MLTESVLTLTIAFRNRVPWIEDFDFEKDRKQIRITKLFKNQNFVIHFRNKFGKKNDPESLG